MNWFVLYVKPQQEKKVAQTLENMDVQVYAPHITEVRQWSDRTKKVEMPLFKSYVFVKVKESERNLVFGASGAVRYLFWLGKPAVVRDAEISIIKEWLDDTAIDAIYTSTLSVGDEVMIKKGPLKNQVAFIEEIGHTKMRLILKNMSVVLNASISTLT